MLYRLLYPGRRPSPVARLVNRAWSWLASRGLTPASVVTLEVKGRRSGRSLCTVLVVGEIAGNRYLVSMLGQRSSWVQNLRAANGEAVMRHGKRQRVRLVEVPANERAPILKAYLRPATGARAHFPLRHDAPVEEFETIASEYPVFRIESPE